MPPRITNIKAEYGKLKVEEIITRKVPNGKSKVTYARCTCKCGNEITTRTQYLREGQASSCGCDRYKTRYKNHRWKGHGDISGKYWNNLMRAAKKRNLEVEITIQDAWDKYVSQNGKCALSGLPIVMYADNKHTLSGGTASLDRIDSDKGYTLDNVQWTHKIINKMKNNIKETEFITLCQTVADFHRGLQ